MQNKFPTLGKSIKNLLSDEDARMTKKKLLGLGMAGALAGIAFLWAESHGEDLLDMVDHAAGHASCLWNAATSNEWGHCSHASHSSHSSHGAHASHASHASHSSHGSHSSHASHASHASHSSHTSHSSHSSSGDSGWSGDCGDCWSGDGGGGGS